VELLFRPYKLGTLDLPHRVVMAPLTRSRARQMPVASLVKDHLLEGVAQGQARAIPTGRAWRGFARETPDCECKAQPRNRHVDAGGAARWLPILNRVLKRAARRSISPSTGLLVNSRSRSRVAAKGGRFLAPTDLLG
jgi:hypothetical protein